MTEDEAKKVFHDLQTPLTVIQGFLKMEGSDATSDERAEMLKAARTSLEKIKTILAQLLSSSRPGNRSVRFKMLI